MTMQTPHNDTAPYLANDKLEAMIAKAVATPQLPKPWWVRARNAVRETFTIHQSWRYGAGFATAAVCLVLALWGTQHMQPEYTFQNDFAEILYFETLEQLS